MTSQSIHGMNKTYRDGCRCNSCTKAHRQRMKYYRITGPTTVPAGPIRDHLLMLREAGITKSQICELTGLGIATVGRIMNDRNSRNVVMKDTAQKILKIKVSDATPRGFFDITIYQRKLRALIAIGWSKKHIAEMLNCGESNINEIVSVRRKMILGDTARRIDALYEKMSMTVGPCNASKVIARRNCWLPPLAWDDIEDLNEKPAYTKVVHNAVVRPTRKPKKNSKLSSNEDTQPVPTNDPTGSKIAV